MKHQNRFMSRDGDMTNSDNLIVLDQSETPLKAVHEIFNTQNPIFFPALLGSFGVLCVCIILFRAYIYRIVMSITYRNGISYRRLNTSKLRSP